MKAEERHELRENDLSGWLQFGVMGFVRQYGSYILLVAALAFLGYTLWQRHLQSQIAERNAAFASYWDAIKGPSKNEKGQVVPGNEDLVPNADGTGYDTEKSYVALNLLPDMADKSPYPEIKVLASMELAKLYTIIAANPAALQEQNISRWDALGKAYEAYKKALDVRSNDPLIAGRAHLGMASVYESRGEWDRALDEYKTVINDPLFAGPMADYAKVLSDPKNVEARRNAPQLTSYVSAPRVAPPTSNPRPMLFPPAATRSSGDDMNFGGSLDLGHRPTPAPGTTPPAPQPGPTPPTPPTQPVPPMGPILPK